MKKKIFYILILLFISFTVDARSIQESECLDELGCLAGEYYLHFKTVPDSLSEMKSFKLYKDSSAIRRIEFYEELFSIKFEKDSSRMLRISVEKNQTNYILLYSIDTNQNFSFFENQIPVRTYQRDLNGNILGENKNLEFKPLLEVPSDGEYKTSEKQVI